jgi:hypothetical protein
LKAKINCLLKGLTPLPAETVQRYKNQEIPGDGAWRGHNVKHWPPYDSPGENLRRSVHCKEGETSFWTSGYRPSIEAQEDQTGISSKSVKSGEGSIT